MREFFKRHRGIHIWAAAVIALFLFYGWAISSREAANAVSAATQVIKDGYARFWYLFSFSVVSGSMWPSSWWSSPGWRW